MSDDSGDPDRGDDPRVAAHGREGTVEDGTPDGGRAVAPAALVAESVPFDREDATFEAPWQARAFGLAVALAEHDPGAWEAFRRRIGRTIGDADQAAMQADVEETYYERWLACLEGVLLDRNVVDADELDRRTAAFSEGERDAAEFVVEGTGERVRDR